MSRETNYIYRIEKSYSKYFEKLYKDTYWGNGGYHTDHIDRELIICKNRDTLAEKYALKSCIKNIPKKYSSQVEVLKDKIYIQQLAEENPTWNISLLPRLADHWYRDHPEYYRTQEGNLVSIFSTYDTSDEVTQLNLRNGYVLVDPIYNSRANTFVKLIYK